MEPSEKADCHLPGHCIQRKHVQGSQTKRQQAHTHGNRAKFPATTTAAKPATTTATATVTSASTGSAYARSTSTTTC